MRTFLIALVFALLGPVFAQPAIGQPYPLSNRQKIIICARAGALTIPAMQACSGFIVPEPDFVGCVSGQWCLGEPPIGPAMPPLPPGVPFCGAMGTPPCPSALPCGYPGTIPCPGTAPPFVVQAPTCGVAVAPPCAMARPCGVPGNLPCPSPSAPPIFAPGPLPIVYGIPATVSFNVPPPPNFTPLQMLPGGGPGTNTPANIQFAMNAMPDLGRLERCKSRSGDEEEFATCMLTGALSGPAHLTIECLSRYGSDLAMAALCSTGKPDLTDLYATAQAATKCAEQASGSLSELRDCVGNNLISEEVLQCLDQQGSARAACLLENGSSDKSKALIECAGQADSSAIAACVTGRLLGNREQKVLGCIGNPTAMDALNCIAGDRLGNEERKIYACAAKASSLAAMKSCAGGMMSTEAARYLDCASTGNQATAASCIAKQLYGPETAKLLECTGSATAAAECAGRKLLGSQEQKYLNCAVNSQGSTEDLATCLGSAAMGSRERKLLACATSTGSSEEAVACAAGEYMGKKEQMYLNCAVQNQFQMAGTVGCALSQQIDMNAEMQIAVGCAMTSGGEPMVFATCTAGQLSARELEKCWAHGIATDQGCFGPNNSIRKFYDSINGEMKRILGANSEAYKMYELYHKNVLAPGPNHEVVKALNTALNDVKHGPGPNNDVVKVVNQAKNAINSVTKSIGVKF